MVVHKRRSMAKLTKADHQSGLLAVHIVKTTVVERSHRRCVQARS